MTSISVLSLNELRFVLSSVNNAIKQSPDDHKLHRAAALMHSRLVAAEESDKRVQAELARLSLHKMKLAMDRRRKDRKTLLKELYGHSPAADAEGFRMR